LDRRVTMNDISSDIVGKRVELVYTDDPYTKPNLTWLGPDTYSILEVLDSQSSIRVRWD
jgi:hypothetical protein